MGVSEKHGARSKEEMIDINQLIIHTIITAIAAGILGSIVFYYIINPYFNPIMFKYITIEQGELIVHEQPNVITLLQLQKIVEGYIERFMYVNSIGADGEVDFFCNEDGKRKLLKPNIKWGNDIIVGNIVIAASDDDGEPRSLTDGEIEFVKSIYDWQNTRLKY